MNKKEFDKNRRILRSAFLSVKDGAKRDKFLNSSRRSIIMERIASVILSMDRCNDKWLNFCVIENVVQFSYCKDTTKDKDITARKNRVDIKLGRYFSKFFSFEDFANDYIVKNVIATLMPDNEFGKLVKIVTGDAIGSHYYNTRVRTCMTGPDNNSKLKMYTKNPDKIGLLTVDGYDCRAFVWTTDDGTKVLDRIYPSGHSLIPTIRKWAKSQGYVLRESADQYVRCYGNINLDDGKFYQVTLNPVTKYPFVDTFCFAEHVDDKLVVSNEYQFGTIGLQNQHGLFVQFFKCPNCKLKVVEDEQYEFISSSGDRTQYCQTCYNTLVTTCACCSAKVLKSETKNPNSMTGSVCMRCLEKYYKKCSSCENMHKTNRIKEINGEHLCPQCYSNKYTSCECCGKNDLRKNTDDVVVSDDANICKNCFKTLKNCEHCGQNIFNNRGKEIDGKIYCSYCARYKVNSNNNDFLMKKNTMNYISHDDYKEIINYISTKNSIL